MLYQSKYTQMRRLRHDLGIAPQVRSNAVYIAVAVVFVFVVWLLAFGLTVLG